MSLRYLLDTHICIYITKQKPSGVLKKFEQMAVGTVAMSIITYGELACGAQKSHHTKKAFSTLEELTALIPSLPMSLQVARHYGEIRSQLEKKGNTIGNNDLWIAAHASSLDVILVTNNEREFARVPHLHIENWVA